MTFQDIYLKTLSTELNSRTGIGKLSRDFKKQHTLALKALDKADVSREELAKKYPLVASTHIPEMIKSTLMARIELAMFKNIDELKDWEKYSPDRKEIFDAIDNFIDEKLRASYYVPKEIADKFLVS